MKRRWIALFLALTMAASLLAGCTKKSDTPAQPEQGQTEQEENQTQPEENPAEEEQPDVTPENPDDAEKPADEQKPDEEEKPEEEPELTEEPEAQAPHRTGCRGKHDLGGRRGIQQLLY